MKTDRLEPWDKVTIVAHGKGHGELFEIGAIAKYRGKSNVIENGIKVLPMGMVNGIVYHLSDEEYVITGEVQE